MQEFKKSLVAWNKKTDNFAKLQAGYAALAAGLFLLAGIVGLIQYSLGQTLLFFALILTLTFVANGVMFALIRTFIAPTIERSDVKARKK